MNSILVVDDSASIRQTLRITLSAEGFAISEASDGSEGINCAKGNTPDLIITDLNMPNVDGLSMIRQLRKLPAMAGVPIVFLSTESDTGMKNQARAAGATGWITKPFNPAQLVQVVKKVLAR